jgi:hypothetical protein
METCFAAAELAGLRIPRPRTFVVHDISSPDPQIIAIGHSRPLIFKPSGSGRCQGIVLTEPGTFTNRLVALKRSPYSRFVAQELHTNTLAYRGHKFDLRLYVLVTSFSPLNCVVAREGVVRLAAKPTTDRGPLEPLAVLTGCSFRKRCHAEVRNLTVTALLAYLDGSGINVSLFWEKADSLIKKAFAALGRFGQVEHHGGTSGHFYFAGVDLLMIPDQQSFSLLFLETNALPDLTGWGSGVDKQLHGAYKQIFTELKTLAEIRHFETRSSAAPVSVDTGS